MKYIRKYKAGENSDICVGKNKHVLCSVEMKAILELNGDMHFLLYMDISPYTNVSSSWKNLELSSHST